MYGIALCQRFFLAANKGTVADTELPRRTREKASGTQSAGYIINKTLKTCQTSNTLAQQKKN